MSLAAHLRSVVLPFAVAFNPLLWFVNREAGIAIATTDRSVSLIHLQAIESAGVALSTVWMFLASGWTAARTIPGDGGIDT